MRRPALLSPHRMLAVHRWLGLVLAPLLLVQAATGALLVIHELTPQRAPAAPAPVSALVAAAAAASPGARVTRLYPAGPTGSAAFAELAGADGARSYAELDPASGRVLAQGALWRFPYRAAVQLHYRLGAGIGGQALVLLVGLGLASLALAGLVVWWPGAGRVRQALRIRPGLPVRLRLKQQHRTVGAIVAGLALFSAATGLLVGTPDLLAGVGAPAAAAAAVPAPPPAAAIDRAVAIAQARFPGAALRDVRFPPADRIDCNLAAPARNARATHRVSVRPSDGSVIAAVAAQDNPVLWMTVLPLHTGEVLPLLGPLLLLGEAGALLFLAYAGTRLWWTGRRPAGRQERRP